MKTIKQILVLALFALGCLYLYNLQHKVSPPNPNLPEETKKVAEAFAVTSSSSAILNATKKENVNVQTNTPKTLEATAPKTLPTGQFVVKERFSKVTDHGVQAFNVGERVNQVSGGYTNGKFVLEVPFDRLTNSTEEISQIDESLKPVEKPQVVKKQEAPKIQDQIPMLPTQPVENPRIAQIDAQILSLKAEIERIQNKYGSKGKVNSSGVLIRRVQMQIDALEAERAQLTK